LIAPAVRDPLLYGVVVDEKEAQNPHNAATLCAVADAIERVGGCSWGGGGDNSRFLTTGSPQQVKDVVDEYSMLVHHSLTKLLLTLEDGEGRETLNPTP
jgi:hypothetical protein